MYRDRTDRNFARLVVAGAASGVGKTTIATGIMGAFARRGLRVHPFKVGPDYIDPGYHQLAAGVPSRNLDSWMLPAATVRELFSRPAAKADVAVIEGVMGLYDGRTGEGEVGSTAHVAKLLDAPVVLVLDAGKVARSAAATVLGFRQFDPDLRLAGVILNNLGSQRHREMIEEAIQEATDLPVLGGLLRHEDLHLPERHLGLITAIEHPLGADALDRLIDRVAEGCDVDRLLALAQSAGPTPEHAVSIFPRERVPSTCRIAVALDAAFSFYYEDNWNLLAMWGAELVPFSPLRDTAFPDGVHGLYLGGGYPEEYAADLAGNTSMLAAIRAAAAAGMPVYAECGGFMYLCEAISDFEGRSYPMVGVVPGRCAMQRRRVGLGYREVEARRDTLLLSAGSRVRGHEFHWSVLEGALPQEDMAYDVLGEGRDDGFAQGNILASYIHLHFGADPDLAKRFVAACTRWSEGSRQ
ncbi:MAG: cobyrinate a,c-diamide synthase [Chloroflexi bacterium]|nr:cobyrinate a,c-diamide synthase [Chloroflexota bacterium]